jgi:glycine hydroxymethyltransferase
MSSNAVFLTTGLVHTGPGMDQFIPSKSLSNCDPDIHRLIGLERTRQFSGLELIASENFTSQAVMETLGTHLTNKYSEGLPGRRYYGGNEIIDQIEILCRDRALKAFRLDPNVWHVNVQSLSGSPANFQVMTALLNPGDRIMGLDLPSGGHLSHGYQTEKKKISAPAIYFSSHAYQTDPTTGLLNYDQIELLVKQILPKMLICGASAYPRDWNYSRLRQIADSVGAILLADIAHISGLVLTQQHNNPFDHCHIVTTTTHKTLRGPRGALIFCLNEYGRQIDEAVFPGCQGGPHNNVIAGIAVALQEAMKPDFTEYIIKVKSNAVVLANEMIKRGFTLVTGGTDNHLMLWDLRPLGLTGSKMEKVCDLCHITLNKNTVPGDKSALSPGGVRIGTPALTSRGFGEKEMIQLAGLLEELVTLAIRIQDAAPSKKLTDFESFLSAENCPFNDDINRIRQRVHDWATQFPLPGI